MREGSSFPELRSHLRLARHGDIATLTVDRTARRNAFTKAMWDAVPGLVSEASDARVLVLRGAGGTFCAGADISGFAMERAGGAPARAYEASNEAAFAALRESVVPTIALVRGPCIGGGFGLAAACDLRFATPDAVFAVPAARLGLAYPVRAMADIVASVGPMRARQMLVTADRCDAATMADWGFLTEVVAEEAIDAHVTAVAARIAANAPLTLRAARAAIAGRGDAASLADATFESTDYAEGVAAFVERRGPNFSGR